MKWIRPVSWINCGGENRVMISRAVAAFFLLCLLLGISMTAPAAEKFTTIHSSRVMSQSMPWMAEEAGLFKKYNLDYQQVFISSSSLVTAALLSGDAEI